MRPRPTGWTGHVVAHHLHDLVNPAGVEGMTLLHEDEQLAQCRHGGFDRRGLTFEGNLVPPRDKPDLREMGLHLPEVAVRLPE